MEGEITTRTSDLCRRFRFHLKPRFIYETCIAYSAISYSVIHSLAPSTAALTELASKADELYHLEKVVEKHARRARWEGMHVKKEVKVWLNSVEEFNAKFNNNLIKPMKVSRYSLHKAVRSILLCREASKRCDELIKQAMDLGVTRYFFEGVADKLTPEHHVERQSLAYTVGMKPMMYELKGLFENNDVKIIGIHGMGGSGKTELLAKFHNSYLAYATHLDVVIWIDVGNDVVGIDHIQKAIGTRLGLKWNANKLSEQERKDVLFKVLGTMSFVLILDDLWGELDFRRIGVPIPRPESNCKIVFTTRSEEVCDWMNADKIKMRLLTVNESLQLFKDKVGKEISSSNEESIVNNCDGLPLAINEIAAIMARQESNDEWSQTCDVFMNHPYQLGGIVGVLSSLKQSYDNLADDKLKACLLTLCILPNNQNLDLKVIEEQWKSDSELNLSSNHEVPYLLGILRASSLIDTASDGFSMISMHPMIRAMLLWIVNDCEKDSSKLSARVANKCKDKLDAEKRKLSARVANKCKDKLDAEMWKISAQISSGFRIKRYPLCRRQEPKRLKLSTNYPCELMGVDQILNSKHSYTVTCMIEHQKKILAAQIKCLCEGLGTAVKVRYSRGNSIRYVKRVPYAMFAGLFEQLIRDSCKRWKSEGCVVNIEECENLKHFKELHFTTEDPAASYNLDILRMSYVLNPSVDGFSMNIRDTIVSAMVSWIACGYGKLENNLLRYTFKVVLDAFRMNHNGAYIYLEAANCPRPVIQMPPTGLQHIPHYSLNIISPLERLYLAPSSIKQLPWQPSKLLNFEFFESNSIKVLEELMYLNLYRPFDLKTIPRSVFDDHSSLIQLWILDGLGSWEMESRGVGVDFELKFLEHINERNFTIISQKSNEKLKISHIHQCIFEIVTNQGLMSTQLPTSAIWGSNKLKQIIIKNILTKNFLSPTFLACLITWMLKNLPMVKNKNEEAFVFNSVQNIEVNEHPNLKKLKEFKCNKFWWDIMLDNPIANFSME